jgi:hypothetical protein
MNRIKGFISSLFLLLKGWILLPFSMRYLVRQMPQIRALLCVSEADRILKGERYQDPLRLEPYGFKCYSQHDEDGILAEIIKRIAVPVPKTFVEFGVGDGLENNTLYLLKQGWKGLWIEADAENARKIQKSFKTIIDDKQLVFLGSVITRDNINELVGRVYKGQVGLLSIDIDGNDLYVWERIDIVSPCIAIVEYNAKFPPPVRWSIEYDERHVWDRTDYMGASLAALAELGKKKGYQLVGCNLNGTNAFFVRKDLVTARFLVSDNLMDYYNPPRYHLLEVYSHLTGHKPDPRMGRSW